MHDFDTLVVGGGINGTAIARDLAMRGEAVLLVERDDLASHTSAASSKLAHGGLRYLEQYELRLVGEALRERRILLDTAPHITRPLAFVLPDAGTRRWWMVRAGLALYDLLSLGGGLPRARKVQDGKYAAPLLPARRSRLALYWDAWVDDARLVALNAVAAAEHGAQIATRTALIAATREGSRWRARLSDGRTVTAGAIVNAAGPWVEAVLRGALVSDSESRVRLVKGSHIVVPALYDGDHAYILQQPDRRVVFALPYEGRFTLIGTTDIPVDAPEEATVDAAEIDYLCAAANLYFTRQIGAGDIAWSFAGIRALHDDGAAAAQAVTRDYRLELDNAPGPPLLSVFGGKITTARALAEEAARLLGHRGRSRTRNARLPGGEMGDDSYSGLLRRLEQWMPEPMLHRLASAYGARITDVVGGAVSLADMGRDFGAGLHAREVDYLVAHEFAHTAEDILWRRTKLGLHIGAEGMAALRHHLGD